MRLFVAVDFPEEVKRALSALSFELVRQADAGRTIPRENFHVTLVFIGETLRVSDVSEAMVDACRAERERITEGRMTESDRPPAVILEDHPHSHEPLRVKLHGIGSFKGHKGYTWWVGLEKSPQLERLANRLAQELRSSGFTIEKRAFMPHVTIGRSVVTSRPVDLELPELTCAATNIALMRSDHKDGHQVYKELFSCAV